MSKLTTNEIYEIENFILYFTSDTKEREDMHKILEMYIRVREEESD